ncbi:hypothetical protein DLAC_11526 [Tieghemostelium lacteum]|uniref:DUF676 domain-containing protein n=1 Tax=Tieghemostelium lacteum TaxID=361077 RepID=A0A152A2Z3_TIELA|nr:hypothetical protein DLAC_11526 [Tieghemostelium lacteum]|eukprot:KYR00574.1 hypothetical protein DLAC_11526 [Tieghemostelium lacteum]
MLKKLAGIPKYPIVLCHGLFGFSEIGPFVYFHNITSPLKAMGIHVEATTVHPTDSIANRANQLYQQILDVKKKYNTDKVHVIAHSMGGLDARYAISKLDYGQSIMSLTTLSTPHRGSYISEWTKLYITDRIQVERILKLFSIPFRAIDELAPKYIKEEFNTNVLDNENVQYYSYGAWCKQPKFRALGLSPLIFYFHSLLQEKEGPNDGLVSLASSKWGSQFQTIENCDHRDLINWSKYDALPIYLDAINRLYTLEKQIEFQEKGIVF